MRSDFPFFKFHPNPFFTNTVILDRKTRCVCCNNARGYIYTGHVYSGHDLDDSLCPWCIADGSAHEKFEAEFVDHITKQLPSDVEAELRFRTPSYRPWQSVYWLVCCGAPAEYWGTIDRLSIRQEWAEAQPLLRALINAQDDDDRFIRYMNDLDTELGAGAYIFRCKKCRKLLAHTDFD